MEGDPPPEVGLFSFAWQKQRVSSCAIQEEFQRALVPDEEQRRGKRIVL